MQENANTQPKGVDQGWSWVIAGVCFLGSFILAGIFRTSGVLFVAFIQNFGVTREEASWPMVVCIAVLNLTGPFSGMLGQRFGIRPIVVLGALIATFGIASCYLTTSLKVITVLFGGVFGIGYGLINTLMPVILNAYFLNLRATANGIANSGSCIGSMVLPIIFEFLISTYGLSGCFLLTSGIVLHLTVAGALMRPPPFLEWKKQKEIKSVQQKNIDIFDQRENVPEKHNDKTSTGYSMIKDVEECAETVQFSLEHSITNHRQKETDLNSSLLSNNAHDEYNGQSQSCSKQTTCEPLNKFVNSRVISSFIEVLQNPMFYITASTNVCFYFLYHMYVVIIVDYALDRDVLESDTKYILLAFSISDLFGRLCFGWITDRRYISRSHFVMLCMILIGVVFFLFPYANGYSALIVVSCAYGLLLGCTMVIFPILLVDFCGIELHAVAYGCMCFMNGFASFARPFLIGYFRDNIGSYSSMFYILGGISVTAAILWLLEFCFHRKENFQTRQTI